MEENITKPGGLHTDSSYVNQPKGTITYMLNGVNETEQGDLGNRANEEANEQCYELSEGYIPLGKVYIGNGDTIIFSVAFDEQSSEIGIADRECNYSVLVNADLGFSLSHQIDAIYRLRRGCERTIYFVTPKPMIYNINKPREFQDSIGNWDADKFKLNKIYKSIPHFLSLMEREGGNLAPGSYNFSIQYLDEDLNPTEWITSTETIKIYNDPLNRDYKDIRGSTSLVNNYQSFGNTGKSISGVLNNLDTSFPFYRIAVIESNLGTGQINSVKYSQEIPIQIKTFNYTGTNFPSVGTTEEVLQFNNIIDEAEHIEQIENILILANTKGKQVNFCNLQKYASRIKSDVVLKTIILNSISEANPKSGNVDFYGTGYMPGEIYSFGIVYIFEDGTQSPAYHIPGKNINTANSSFTSNGLPMSVDNTCETTLYTDLGSCDNADYWGYDSEGLLLKNTRVRHHRFPLRSEANLPLLEEQELIDESINVNQLTLAITGTPVDSTGTINYEVVYTVGGVESSFQNSFEIAAYDPIAGINLNIVTSIDEIIVTSIKENGVVMTNGVASATGFTYTTTVGPVVIEVGQRIYTSQIMGIQFSGIDLPSLQDTDGNKIVSYYIVRNERTEEEKTILDSGVFTPLMKHEFFVAHGQLMPELDNDEPLKDDGLALIHPEHKFKGREYKATDEIIKEGEFRLRGDRSRSSVFYEDVMAGTSYDPEVSKRRESDSDGFDLNLLTRDNEVKYFKTIPRVFTKEDIQEIFYLDTLTSKVVTDHNDDKKEIYNISGDNKIGIVQFSDAHNIANTTTRLPYVILKRKLTEPYANFRVLPYYKVSGNPHDFEDPTESAAVFNGDSYVTPMRYHSAVFYDIRLRKRDSKGGVLNIVLGVIAIIVGAVVAYFGGAALGGMLIAFGASQIASGIKKDQIAKVYGELYDAGLRETVKDKLTVEVFEPNPADDTIQWLGDTVTNLWFESGVNMALRQGATYNMTDFLNAPAPKARPGGFGYDESTFPPTLHASGSAINELDSYLVSKLTVLDPDNGDGRLYLGYATAEIYQINPDYERRNKQKIFEHLGIEYDCCSECLESFPHRYHYSLQSFQEELTDNYRVFLPNNYKDLEGEKGVITNLYKLQDNLYAHTEEALWHLPNSRQERVNNDIVTYIGTGSFFDIPPKKIVDSLESSAGTSHKWGCIKTKNGILFPSILDRKWYLFDGNQLKPISDQGNSSYFKNNMPFKAEQDYYSLNGRNYPYSNVPSNPFGIGFLSVYDTAKERLIITKRDFLFNKEAIPEDSEICFNGGEPILFPNYQDTIDLYINDGYIYLGIENCRMKFAKNTIAYRTEYRNTYSTISSTADIHNFLDTSGSFDVPALTTIKNSVDAWFAQYKIDNPEFTGNLYHHQTNTDLLGIGGLLNQGAEQWVSFPSYVAQAYPPGTDMSQKDIILISFCNESDPIYTTGDVQVPMNAPTTTYLADYANFINNVYPSFKSFIGIHYPIIFDQGIYEPQSRSLLLMILASLKGTEYTPAEIDNLEVNPAFSLEAWNTLEVSLQAFNPYPSPGLENFGWSVKSNRYRKPDGTVISAEEFADDINTLLSDVVTVTPVEVQVQYLVNTIEYVDGQIIDTEDIKLADNSWTMSYSLKENSWLGWHSYTPNFYFYQSERFYAWVYGSNFIWKFNKKGKYQTYFGQYYPFVIEYVSLSNPLINMIWDYIMFQTEAKRYSEEFEDYIDQRYVTFNKALFYNTQQISGVLNLQVKDTRVPNINYLEQQVANYEGEIVIDRNERNWTLNFIRDYRSNYETPMFIKTITDIQDTYPIDKIVNPSAIDTNKVWYELESFRDKFLVVRFIFDNFDDVRLLTNYLIEFQNKSER